jgi:Yip1 domain
MWGAGETQGSPMNLVARVQNILLKPAAEWPVIEAEASDIKSIYIPYLVILAAIPAVASFIGLSVFGMSVMGMTIRPSFLSGVGSMISSYVLSLLMFYAMAFIIDALAPTFDSQKNLLSAFKLVAYSSTAAMVAGVFLLIPSLGILYVIGAFYSLYLLFVGLPILMKCPAEKALPFTITVVVLMIVAGIVLGIVSNMFTPSPTRGAGMPGSAVTVDTPGGKVTIDTAAIEAMTKKMEASNERMEAAQKSGDPAAAGKAAAEAMGNVGAMMGAVTGSGTREPIPLADLKALMPEAIGDFKRESFETSGGAAMGVKNSTVKASFRSGDATLRLEVVDLGNLGGLAAMAGMVSAEGEKEDANSKERTYKDGKRLVKEQSSKTGKSAGMSVILANGVSIDANGNGVDLATLKGAVASLNLAKLESYVAK